jgi:hypothetical protein
MPPIRFYLSTAADPVDRNHPLWDQPLPDRRAAPAGHPDTAAGRITYGDYYSAVARFCAANDWALILRAAAHQLARPVAATALRGISIFLEKHGAFYHPARLVVETGTHTFSLVVNVAVSADGRRTLPREVHALERLNDRRPFGWLPQIYGCETTGIPMFLGDWFDGFHEFHLTRSTNDSELGIVVWDGADTPTLLSTRQAADLYRQAAMIMTACYDPISACQIFPWHHGAGDFVVRVDGEGVTVRLITVRDYRPVTGSIDDVDTEGAILDALVVFLIHLSLRMRLDRLDGIGAIAWAPARCLGPIIEGFFQGLDLTARINGFPEAFPDLFRRYVSLQAGADVAETARQIAKTVFDRHTEEHRVVGAHLERHVHNLCRLMTN